MHMGGMERQAPARNASRGLVASPWHPYADRYTAHSSLNTHHSVCRQAAALEHIYMLLMVPQELVYNQACRHKAL